MGPLAWFIWRPVEILEYIQDANSHTSQYQFYFIEILSKKNSSSMNEELFVQAERLELSHLAAPDPKSGMSTNFTIPAKLKFFTELGANIMITSNFQSYF